MKKKSFARLAMLASLGSVFLSGNVFAADDLPKALNFSRYASMLNHSPFAVATAVAGPAATPDFAKDLFIANAAHSPEGDLVTLASSTDNNFKKYLTSKDGVDGYSIANIEWSDRVGETKVTISKDGQFATLSFNQALLSQSLARGGPGVNVSTMNNLTPQGQQPINRIRPAPIPMLPTPPPHVRGIIQRNPSGHKQPPAPNVPPEPE
ncbi:MAG: hypothetical protein M3O66_01330, partial [Verrucomicrobiota bacterium]|nr:hypothetical protein [Verrucomicrobiota bacterium]